MKLYRFNNDNNSNNSKIMRNRLFIFGNAVQPRARALNFSRPHDARIEIKDTASGGKGPPTTKSWKAKREERRDRNHSIKQGDVGSTDRPRNDSPLGETLQRGKRGKRTSTYTQWGPKKRSREQKRWINCRSRRRRSRHDPQAWFVSRTRVYRMCIYPFLSSPLFLPYPHPSSSPSLPFLLALSFSLILSFSLSYALSSLSISLILRCLIVSGVQQGDPCTGYTQLWW